MRIGIDFDNTIVDYTGIFHATGLDAGVIPETVGRRKSDVKNYLINAGNENTWTELQGLVYGKSIADAAPYEGAIDVIRYWKKVGYELHLISHKTKFPIIGERLDFHSAAREWLQDNGLSELFGSINFCPEKTQKIATIGAKKVSWFIDDLPSILLDQAFPIQTSKILFDPSESVQEQLIVAPTWHDINKIVVNSG